jgi:hypothetical protein
MSDGTIHLLRAGAADSVVEQFKTIVESERFEGIPIAKRLSLIITGGRSGNAQGNRDTPIYELCHLVSAITALGYKEASGRFEFFLGLKRATTSAIRQLISEKASENNWPTKNYTLTERGIKIITPGDDFEIWFKRIPVLVAFFEFISGIDDVTFFAEMNDLLDQATSEPISTRKIKDASNGISSKLRLWRRSNISWAEHEEKFDRITPFLSQNSSDGYWDIDDETIFDFWSLNSALDKKPIREYATVFNAFVTLLQVMRSGSTAEAVSGAVRLGTDFEAGEFEVGTDIELVSGDWFSPLATFDHPNLKDIGFFKGESERAPIEQLMEYGPDALNLSHAFLRLESFSPIQGIISNGIRFGRKKTELKTAISCDKAKSYNHILENFRDILLHIEQLQLAVIYLLQPVEENDAFQKIEEAAKKAFNDMRRKGFKDRELNEDQRDAFLMAADVLPTITAQLRNFLQQLEQQDLSVKFDADVPKFSKQFQMIYGERV